MTLFDQELAEICLSKAGRNALSLCTNTTSLVCTVLARQKWHVHGLVKNRHLMQFLILSILLICLWVKLFLLNFFEQDQISPNLVEAISESPVCDSYCLIGYGFWYVVWWNSSVLLLNRFGLALLGRFTKPRTRSHAPLNPQHYSIYRRGGRAAPPSSAPGSSTRARSRASSGITTPSRRSRFR